MTLALVALTAVAPSSDGPRPLLCASSRPAPVALSLALDAWCLRAYHDDLSVRRPLNGKLAPPLLLAVP